MKTAKLGAIFLVSVLALAGIGMGYASWTDTITINGTVNTGSVDIDIVALSGTWVWKIVDTHETEYYHGWGTTLNGPDTDPELPEGSILVASASAEMDTTDADGDTVIVTFDNLYPCDYFMVDFLIHCVGTIPVRLGVDVDFVDDFVQGLYDDGDLWLEAFEYYPTNPESFDPTVDGMIGMGEQIINFCGHQLHYCDWILVKIWIHIPQDDAYMDESGDFAVSINAIQWNNLYT